MAKDAGETFDCAELPAVGPTRETTGCKRVFLSCDYSLTSDRRRTASGKSTMAIESLRFAPGFEISKKLSRHFQLPNPSFVVYDSTKVMATSVRSFAKINLGLKIGPLREDGFHELRTIYQTVALSDQVRVDVSKGLGIEIACKDPRVPDDESNTCWRVADRILRSLKIRSKVRITIEKRLPVQGGLGAASSNAVATMLALEKELKQPLAPEERLRIASEVGSDLPLFLVGGTVLGTGRGEQVYPLEDLPSFHCVIATPDVGVSTPAAFADWDKKWPQYWLTES